MTGTAYGEWTLRTGNGLLPMPDLATALLALAAYTATHTGGESDRAVVLHLGRPWHPDTLGLPGSLRPVLLWNVRCSLCGSEWEDEYSPGFHHVDTAVDQVLDGGWHQRTDGALVCDADDLLHCTARQDP
ncbi:hypothetical protein ACFY00_30615 [Kitasatospora sp. NPDC001540]|uniref:hypothetical protein n=1 Tax=Kitasatospora sp. NPDC001540 TaxID=3364014 RepID=UPI0036C16933